MSIRGIGVSIVASMVVAILGSAVADAASRGPVRDEVSEIIIHATGGPFCQGGKVVFSPAGDVARMKRFFEGSSAVSIHYIVGPDGEIAASVPENEVAYHARYHNDASIGIELINAGDGIEPYPEAQVTALTKLVDRIRRRWRIPLAEIKGHEDVDETTFSCGGRVVRRKQDPGPQFPWSRLRKALTVASGQH